MPSVADALALWMWRHPKPVGADGRCIGRTDLPVDARRAKRLARHVAEAVAAADLPRVVWTSTSQRCADVGRALKRHGFTHCIDARLRELDFGTWDGRRWAGIPHGDVAAWERDFARHAPGGGESLEALVARARSFLAEHAHERALLIVGHGGWMNAVSTAEAGLPDAACWPRAAGYGALLRHAWRGA